MNWVGSDAGKNIGEPSLWIDAIHYAVYVECRAVLSELIFLKSARNRST